MVTVTGWDRVDSGLEVPVSFAVRALAVGFGGPRYQVVSRLRAGRVAEVIGRFHQANRQVWVTAEDRSELVVVV